MPSKLSVYNGALQALGERKLRSLAEACKARRELDSVWDGDTGVQFCLQQAIWNFALNTISLTYSPSVTPPDGFPYTYAFDKPTDWVRTAVVSDDGSFCNLPFDFADQGAYWFANPDTIWVKYVSKGATFGLDPSLWTPNFTAYVEHHFAAKACKSITGSNTDKEQLEVKVKRLLSQARVTDAIDEAPQFIPPGTWSRSRRGGRARSDRGSATEL